MQMMQQSGPAAAASRGSYNSVLSSAPSTAAEQPQPSTLQWRRDSSPPEPRPPPQQVPDIRGKHRKRAELNRLNQEIRFLEEELEKLEKTDLASIACKELVVKIDDTPDPLLPVTKGPANPAWERWFERPTQTESCCWIC